MRLAEFRRLLADEFGSAYAPTVLDGHALREFDSRTAQAALDAGIAPARVWRAICEDFDIPPERRLGRDPRPRR